MARLQSIPGTVVALPNNDLTECESEGQSFTTRRNRSPDDSSGSPPPPSGPGPVMRGSPNLHPSGAKLEANAAEMLSPHPPTPQQIP